MISGANYQKLLFPRNVDFGDRVFVSTKQQFRLQVSARFQKQNLADLVADCESPFARQILEARNAPST